ncbi:methyltransferase domain-containing protein [Micromonospora sp. STR1s_5]|nr:methyltransferase domain-containing protein [Micromonospora sp. STR1s_5]
MQLTSIGFAGAFMTGSPVKVVRSKRGSIASWRVLNVGSGPAPTRLHPIFSSRKWREVTLDADPAVKPDLVGSSANLHDLVPDGAFDAIYASHVLEHLFSHEVLLALKEYRRVLSPSGFALITCPDMESIADTITRNGLEITAYNSPAGPITPLDMVFGHSRSIENGNLYMAHRTGFTVERLGRLLALAGFRESRVSRGTSYDLWALALAEGADLRHVAELFKGAPQESLAKSPYAEVFRQGNQ